MNKREKGIRSKEQRQLTKEAQTQLDRLFDNLVTAQKNIKLFFLGESQVDRLSKVSSASDYILEALEEAVNLRYAFTELSHRYNKIRGQDKEKAERLKLMKTPYQVDVELPGWFDGEQGEANEEK